MMLPNIDNVEICPVISRQDFSPEKFWLRDSRIFFKYELRAPLRRGGFLVINT